MKTWREEHQILINAGFSVDSGLSAAEIECVGTVVGCPLPVDLREFLAEGLPLGKGFPNWREPDSSSIRDQLNWPFEGIAFDIEHNSFWWDDWGARPNGLADAIELARTKVASAPRLIPVMGHRYLPAEPQAAGNPVFSVYQTDIIHYGIDLATYLRCEFNLVPYAEAVAGEARPIRFWTDLVAANGG